ncbi:MAG: hypothetical protein HY678_11715 [Chloroflexi bacterium]|nr:hypothetical protein [Chloroflexota bacterium]
MASEHSRIIVTVTLEGGQIGRHEIELSNDPKRAVATTTLLGELITRTMDGRIRTLILANPVAFYRAAHVSGISLEIVNSPSAEGTLRKLPGPMGFLAPKGVSE